MTASRNDHCLWLSLSADQVSWRDEDISRSPPLRFPADLDLIRDHRKGKIELQRHHRLPQHFPAAAAVESVQSESALSATSKLAIDLDNPL